MRRERRTYNVKVYHCKGCGYIFHTTSRERKKTCHHCGGELEVIDRYKSKGTPRGIRLEAGPGRSDGVIKEI